MFLICMHVLNKSSYIRRFHFQLLLSHIIQICLRTFSFWQLPERIGTQQMSTQKYASAGQLKNCVSKHNDDERKLIRINGNILKQSYTLDDQAFVSTCIDRAP